MALDGLLSSRNAAFYCVDRNICQTHVSVLRLSLCRFLLTLMKERRIISIPFVFIKLLERRATVKMDWHWMCGGCWAEKAGKDREWKLESGSLKLLEGNGKFQPTLLTHKSNEIFPFSLYEGSMECGWRIHCPQLISFFIYATLIQISQLTFATYWEE